MAASRIVHRYRLDHMRPLSARGRCWSLPGTRTSLARPRAPQRTVVRSFLDGVVLMSLSLPDRGRSWWMRISESFSRQPQAPAPRSSRPPSAGTAQLATTKRRARCAATASRARVEHETDLGAANGHRHLLSGRTAPPPWHLAARSSVRRRRRRTLASRPSVRARATTRPDRGCGLHRPRIAGRRIWTATDARRTASSRR